MENRCSKHLLLLLSFLCIYISLSPIEAYQNHTVGGSGGWHDVSKNRSVDYQKWATGKNFSLGDFLIFDTDGNHSVIQSYNVTTYNRCDFDDAENDDTIEWSVRDPSADAQAVSIAVPLLKVGPTYFFSGSYDGEQCNEGQRFGINVTYGQGLPSSLKNSPAPSPDPSTLSDQNLPSDFLKPSNSSNPSDSEPSSEDTSGSILLRAAPLMFVDAKLCGLLILGVLWL